MSYFNAVRLFSLAEVLVFASLLTVAIGDLGEGAEQVLGWTHGVGWIVLCLLVAYGCSFLHPALPWIVTGALLMVYAFLAALPPRSEP